MTFKNLSKFIAIFSLVFFINCNSNSTLEYIASPSIIPAPQEIHLGDGFFEMPRGVNEAILVDAPSRFKNATNFLNPYLGGMGYYDVITNHPEKEPTIVFKEDTSIKDEGYILDVSEEKISITIKDNPKFSYRGMHLDVSRHFFPVEFIKEYIDHLAMLKMNTFHWHLTDDQGWRIEIKQYPYLTKKGAYREETLIGHYNDDPQQFDGKRYGGFYTQEEVKEIVAYATERHVTVIPEIEMPGHSQAAIHAYPALGCTGKQVPVATKWGVFENIYCPKEGTFTFLKNVLDEVMPLFPSEYIHIGGDEAPKEQWKACGDCQKLISEKNLKDEHGLQSYFIREIEKHVNSKGKKIIGWDEILEGGLAPNATVMSWRGTQGAVAAANQGHDVILTPTSHAYFDYYQATYEDEPLAIGGYLPLKKVYSFNPIPKKLQGTDAAKHVLGAQANIWTEYMQTENQVEYMAFPRMLAMGEVVWSGPTENLEKDYPEFLSRVEPFMNRLDVLDINYANHLYDLEGQVTKKDDDILYELKTPTKGKEIKYTINASEELKYEQPIKISEDTQLTAQVYKNGEKVGRPFSETISYHKGINATVSLNVAPHSAYSAGGKEALINGVNGSDTRFGDKEWTHT